MAGCCEAEFFSHRKLLLSVMADDTDIPGQFDYETLDHLNAKQHSLPTVMNNVDDASWRSFSVSHAGN
jgi:hypothetical protein